MDKIKKGLGRGLSSLIGEAKVEPEKNQLQISDLVPNKYQPRKIFDKENTKDMKISIFGILIGEKRVDPHEWLKFQKENIFISKNIVDVFTA